MTQHKFSNGYRISRFRQLLDDSENKLSTELHAYLLEVESLRPIKKNDDEVVNNFSELQILYQYEYLTIDGPKKMEDLKLYIREFKELLLNIFFVELVSNKQMKIFHEYLKQYLLCSILDDNTKKNLNDKLK